jgi:hypothetical protein
MPFSADSAWLTGLKSNFLAFAIPPFFAEPFIVMVDSVIVEIICGDVVQLGMFFGMKRGSWEQIGDLLFYLFDLGISLCKILRRCGILELSLLYR